jgi:hypothetical protein
MSNKTRKTAAKSKWSRQDRKAPWVKTRVRQEEEDDLKRRLAE